MTSSHRWLILALALAPAFPPCTFAQGKLEPFFDVRAGNSEAGRALRESYRGTPAEQASRASGAQATMTRGRSALGARVPQLRIETNPLSQAPEIVESATQPLTAPSKATHESIARSFVAENAEVFGLTGPQAGQLRTKADYANPSGNLSWVELEQTINGIPVFQGTLRTALRADGAIARTTGNLAAGMNEAALATTPKLSSAEAAAAAAGTIGVTVAARSLGVISTSNGGLTHILAKGPFTETIQTDLVYFPLEPGVATLAYAMVLWQHANAYYTVVDAQTGAVLWRKNLTNDQSQTVSYTIYNDDSPTPLSPTNALPGSATAPASINRTAVSVVSELPNFDNLGWITDGGNTTTGNNVDAGIDVDGTDGIDANGRPTGSPNRTFNFTYTPGGASGATAPSLAAYRNGTVTNAFFWANRFHDRLYNYGFTEAAGNFQDNNFGRGGVGNDHVRIDVQDSSSVNTSNFTTAQDGSVARMQLFIFNQPNPQRDSAVDQDVVLHELTHGVSTRLHANGGGLTTLQASGMGEGWSDFYARCLLSTAAESLTGVYANAAYSSLSLGAANGVGGLGTDNYYYGNRRFPYALKTVLGANNKPHNPLTFADIDPAQSFITGGAFPKSPVVSGAATEVHNIGEVWCLALLEVRARIINRLTYAVGNDRVLQIVTDAMKLDPSNPTVVQARNSIIAADTAGFAGADVADIWAGFAAVGLGFGATATSTPSMPAVITESYITPNLVLGTITNSDAVTGNNNTFPEPNETVLITVPLTNPFSVTASNVTVTINGTVVNYGNLLPNQMVANDIPFLVPAATPSGTRLQIPVAINSSLGPVGPVTPSYFMVIGQPVANFVENFDVSLSLPSGWTTVNSGSGAAWTITATRPASAPNCAFTPDVGAVGTSELDSVSTSVTSASAVLSFQNSYNLEAATGSNAFFDGMVLEMSVDGNPFQDIVAAGGIFLSGGYNASLALKDNPLAGRNAWSGLSAGSPSKPDYISTSVLLPSTVAGHTVSFRWVVGCDGSGVATGVAGARIDSVSLTDGTISIIAGQPPVVTTTAGALAYTENQPPQPLDPGVTVTDPDSPLLTSAVVQFTANFVPGEDVLSFAAGGGISGNFDAVNGILTLVGKVTPAAYQAALRTVKYADLSSNPSTLARTLIIAVSDGAESGSGTRKINITPINDPPVANSVNVMTNEDIPKSFTLTGSDPENSPLTFTITQQPLHGQLTGTVPNVTYTPGPNYNGPDSFTFKVSDGQLSSLTDATVSITVVPVNDAPIANPQNVSTNEDTALPITLTGSDVENSPLTFSISTAPQHGTITGSSPNIVYHPAANYFGPDSFKFTANDGTTDGPPATVSITVNAVNDPPSFNVGPDQLVINDTTLKTVPNWATAISIGPGESGQTVSFVVLANQPGLFATQPQVAPNGTLTFQAAANAIGTATVSVTAHDTGGTALGGNDTSAPQMFQIFVNPPNFAPTFTAGPDVIVAQGSSDYSQPWATNISPGAPHESAQVLNFIVQPDHPELFSVAPAISPAGVLSFTPAAGASGLATVTVTLHDDGGTANNGQDTSAPQTFTIAVATFVEEVGTYNGIILPAGKTVEQGRFGSARVTIAATGATTAQVELGGLKYTIKGTVDFVGNVHFGKGATLTTPLPRPGKSTLDLALTLDVTQGTDKLAGAITETGTPFASLDADRALYTSKSNPTPPFMNPPAALIGKYTAIFGAQTPAVQGASPDLYPQGDGIAFITINNAGSAKITGTLADRTKFTSGNALSKSNTLPFHILTDNKKGSVTGPVLFRDIPGVSDLDAANITWIKPVNLKAHPYAFGWASGIGVDVVGSAYVSVPGQPALPGLGAPGPNGNTDVVLVSGGLAIGGLSKAANIDSTNKVLVITPTTDKLSLKVVASTGAVNGSFLFPVSKRSTKISAVILQKSQRAAGFFVSDLASGHISITPAP